MRTSSCRQVVVDETLGGIWDGCDEECRTTRMMQKKNVCRHWDEDEDEGEIINESQRLASQSEVICRQ